MIKEYNGCFNLSLEKYKRPKYYQASLLYYFMSVTQSRQSSLVLGGTDLSPEISGFFSTITLGSN